MWNNVRKIIALLPLSLLCLLLLSGVGICSQSQMYEISESELLTLSNHLNALEANNNELLNLLNASTLDLNEASLSLSESRKELETLRTQLKELQAETKRLSESLRTANEELQNARASFKASEAEHDKIEGRLRNQRNLWEVLCFVAVGVAAAR